MPRPLNNQVGSPLVRRRAPKLDGYEIVGGTWKPADTTKTGTTENADEVPFNWGFWAPGDRVTCQLVQYVQDPPVADLQVSQVIQEVATADNPAPRTWCVMKADPIQFSTGRPQVWDVILERGEGVDMTQVS